MGLCFLSLSAEMGLRDTTSQPPFSDISVSFFGAVQYLSLFHPWGFPFLITGKGATSSDVLFHHHTEQERAECAQGHCKLLPRTEHVRPNPGSFKVAGFTPQLWKSQSGRGSNLPKRYCGWTRILPCKSEQAASPGYFRQNARAGGTCKSLQSSLPIQGTGKFRPLKVT